MSPRNTRSAGHENKSALLKRLPEIRSAAARGKWQHAIDVARRGRMLEDLEAALHYTAQVAVDAEYDIDQMLKIVPPSTSFYESLTEIRKPLIEFRELLRALSVKVDVLCMGNREPRPDAGGGVMINRRVQHVLFRQGENGLVFLGRGETEVDSVSAARVYPSYHSARTSMWKRRSRVVPVRWSILELTDAARGITPELTGGRSMSITASAAGREYLAAHFRGFRAGLIHAARAAHGQGEFSDADMWHAALQWHPEAKSNGDGTVTIELEAWKTENNKVDPVRITGPAGGRS